MVRVIYKVRSDDEPSNETKHNCGLVGSLHRARFWQPLQYEIIQKELSPLLLFIYALYKNQNNFLQQSNGKKVGPQVLATFPKKVVIAGFEFELKNLFHGHCMINKIQLNHKISLKQIYSGLTSNRLFASDHV